MAESPFFLALKLSGAERAGGAVHDVAALALERLGYPVDAAAAILRDIDARLHETVAGRTGEYEIRFRVEGGMLLVTVTGDGPEWRLTRPLPSSD